jgi:hypothetical protein
MLHRLIPVGFALLLPVAAAASALGDKQLGSEPVGPVILTVSGNIERVGSSPVVRLDRAMLEALGTTTLKTTTVWTSEPLDDRRCFGASARIRDIGERALLRPRRRQ